MGQVNIAGTIGDFLGYQRKNYSKSVCIQVPFTFATRKRKKEKEREEYSNLIVGVQLRQI